MSAAKPFSYDVVPYQSNPFPQTHPEHLATIATLFGLQPAPVERCRVLELGCASGGNLIPMALALPEATFVGVDLSERQINDGLEVVRALGLKNLELKHLSITEVDEGFGKFDYISSHGVYSWVPNAVQDSMLDVCRKSLNQNGIAYISYNVYPGWRMRSMIRDMMLFHAGPVADPKERVEQARAMLEFLSKSTAKDNNPYGTFLKQEVELLSKHSDSYLFHEHLEDCNEPLYFYQFEERLRNRGLRYLGEADFRVMVPTNFAPEVQEVLKRVAPDLVHMEQYMDFLRNRTFRQTLFCHAEQRPSYHIRPEVLSKLRVSSPVVTASREPDVVGKTQESFKVGDAALNSADPLTKAALLHLARLWPHSLPFDDLVRAARDRLAGTPAAGASLEEDVRSMARLLLSTFATAGKVLLQMSVWQPPVVREAGERPVASPLGRLQAVRQNWATTMYHQVLGLSDLDRQMLPLLDGSRDRPALAAALMDLVSRGILSVQSEGKKVDDQRLLQEGMARAVDQALTRYARAALLLA